MKLDGITWVEKTQYQLEEARAHQKRAEEKIEQIQKDVLYWSAFAETLEKALQLYREKQQFRTNNSLVDADQMRNQSVWDNIVDISKENNGVLVVVEAVTLLVKAGVFQERDRARNTIYSTLYSHKKQTENLRKGVYRIHEQKLDEQQISNRNHAIQKRQTKVSGVKSVMKPIMEQNLNITEDQVIKILKDNEFNFSGHDPKKTIHLPFVQLKKELANNKNKQLEHTK